MKKNIYSIKDVKVGYGIPFHSLSDATAVRELKVAVNAPKGTTIIADCPEDFQLYRIGSFDTDTGEFTNDFEFIQNAPIRDEDR